eukprot:m.286946 g.286946  ORF g.286946 m.286946 type:complete len:427 (+) comp17781_c0_seq14:315-1595(+)
MTGRFPADLQVNSNWAESVDGWQKNAAAGLPYFLSPDLPNVASTVKASGYRTGHFGKWHLGGFAPPNESFPLPSDYGFDLTATYNSVIQGNASLANSKNVYAGNSSDAWWDADVDASSINHTMEFITGSVKADTPFYINLWLHMTHDTIDPRPEWIEPYPFEDVCLFAATTLGINYCSSQIYWSAQTKTDYRLGQLMAWLDKQGIRNDTLVVFSSDNGAQTRGYTEPNAQGTMDSAVGVQGPFRGSKASLYDGGHRVPFIVSWPGRVPMGRVDHSLLSSVDFLPTIASITNSPIPNGTLLRGEDISEILFGKLNHQTSRKKPLFWRGGSCPPPCQNRSPGLAVRTDDMKLLINPDGSRVELYNMSLAGLSDHLFETQNLADQHPDIVARLRDLVFGWHNSIPVERPGATNKSMSVQGCSKYKIPGF